MNQNQMALRCRAEAALTELKSIRLRKCRNPFSRRGPIAAMLRKSRVLKQENVGLTFLRMGLFTEAWNLYSRAFAWERNPFFRSVIGAKLARVELTRLARAPLSGEEWVEGSLRAAESMRSAAELLEKYDSAAARRLYELSREFLSITGQPDAE